MTARFVLPLQAAYDSSGSPLAGATLEFYESGTSTPLTVYTDSSLSIPASTLNSLTADSSGRFGNIFMSVDSYKVILKDSIGNTVFTADPYDIEQIYTISEGLESVDTGILRSKISVNSQTGTSYTVLTTDRATLITRINSSAMADTLPQANTTTFPSGWFCYYHNRGTGVVTITPTTSTIDGASSIALYPNDGIMIVCDGTNYYTFRGKKSITDMTAKTTLEDADQLGVADSADSNKNKKITWANVKAELFAEEVASQSTQNTGTSAVKLVVPSNQHFHKSAGKFWVNFDGAADTINTSYNVSSITDIGNGLWTVSFTNAFSTGSSYTASAIGTGSNNTYAIQSVGTTSVGLACVGAVSGSGAEPSVVTVSGFGILA